MDPDVTWRRGRGWPLVVHYWADLQSGHGLRCYGNITRTPVTSLRPSRDRLSANGQLGGVCTRCWPVTGRRRGAFSTLLRRPGLRAPAFHWWRSGNITRTQNVSKYMFVLALCLVLSLCLVPCSRLSWLLLSFQAHVKIFHRIVAWIFMLILFYFISDVVPCWNKIILGRSTEGGVSGPKFFKITLFEHKTKPLQKILWITCRPIYSIRKYGSALCRPNPSFIKTHTTCSLSVKTLTTNHQQTWIF